MEGTWFTERNRLQFSKISGARHTRMSRTSFRRRVPHPTNELIIEPINYKFGSFDEIESKKLGVNQNDSIVIPVTGDLSRFVEGGTGKMEAHSIDRKVLRKYWQPSVGIVDRDWVHFSLKIVY